MLKFNFKLWITMGIAILSSPIAMALPKGFVYLSEVDPTIVQDMRYAGYHNFVGRPIAGYETKTCILTSEAAEALKNIQASLKPQHLSLKVYDCYRPQMAVEDFYTWSKDPSDNKMKAEFYPNVDKSQLFQMGYIARRSSHTMGSTVDLTLVPVPTPNEAVYTPGQRLVACYAPYSRRFKDNSIDMGTGYDCLDVRSHYLYKRIKQKAEQNRTLLRSVMIKNGFEPYAMEWWHFTLKNQPYPDHYFNFPV